MIKEETLPMQKSSMLEVLRNRNFLLLWMAQILSQTAQQIINFALLLQVSDITKSSTAVSGVIISFTVPAILFAAIAGVFVERNSKKTVLVMTNLARGAMVLAYVGTDASWGPGPLLPVFYIVTLLFSAVSQFFNPAELAMIPLIVKRDQLVSANSLFNLSFTACQLVGFVVLGPLLLATVLHNDYAKLYIILCGLLIICAALTYFLPQDQPGMTAAARRQRGEKVGVTEVAAGAGEIAKSGFQAARDELVEGWSFIRKDPVLMSAIIFWSISITVFMMLGAIGPNFLEKVLGIPQDRIIYIMVPGGFGLLVGVLVVGRIAHPTNREAMMNWALLLAGAVLVIFALIEPVTRWLFSLVNTQPPDMLMLGLLGLMAFMLGLLNSFIAVPAQTALQERSPEDKRARVFSVFFTMANIILIVPVLIASTLADSLGYTPTVALTGVVVLLISGAGLRASRKRVGLQLPSAPSYDGHVTTEEVESALSAATPAPQPLPTVTQRGKTEK